MSAAAAEVRRVDQDDDGGFGLARQSAGMVDVASTRAAQEVQAAMVIAKRFPRNETASYQRIMQACKRKALAERAVYAYPRGGETVSGPSIRLAEVLAQSWGNIDFGVIELEQKNGESTMMSYAWDLETNTRQAKVFTIRHERHTKSGVKRLTDPRDVYELAANQGARRLRACILGVIPGDVVDAALAECEKTAEGNNSDPLPDRIRKMVAAFTEIGVNQDAIEAKLRHKMDATTAVEIRTLGKIFNSIRDGFSSIESHFDTLQAPEQQSDAVSDLNSKLKAAKPAQQQPAPAAAKPEPVEAPKDPPAEVKPEPAVVEQPASNAEPVESRPGDDVSESVEEQATEHAATLKSFQEFYEQRAMLAGAASDEAGRLFASLKVARPLTRLGPRVEIATAILSNAWDFKAGKSK